MAVKKSTGKKAGAKKVASKVVKKSAAPKVLKLAIATKPFTKTELQKTISEHVGITKKQVAEVFNTLVEIIKKHLTKGAAGTIKLEGLLKIDRINKLARKARKGVNPFTGEEIMFKAKPAHSVVKIRALKKLKGMV